MRYTNPIIFSDYSDPDVIRVGEDYYMVSSSFNYVPGVPVLHSKNLVQWRIVGHVLKSLPFEKFNSVRHGEGAWAPSLRFHGGKFYCLIPFPDEGIFVSEADDPCGEWSPLRPLLEGSGYEDPCPLWWDGRCYVVFAFVKSRAGFNSLLAVFEADEALTRRTSDYKIIYDGHDVAPKIEGPKFIERGGYVYILAPAGGVKAGWQVALRSRGVYGPYQTKIILMQGDSDVNGPHQGALVDLEGGGWAFVHFQDRGPYGRVVHLQPAIWRDDWPFCGDCSEQNLPGTPVECGQLPAGRDTDYTIDPSDEFRGRELSAVWQMPANPREDAFSLCGGLKLNCIYYGGKALSDLPRLLTQKVYYPSFDIRARCRLHLAADGDEAGFVMFGRSYHYVCAVRRGGVNYLELRRGAIGGEEDEILSSSPCEGYVLSFRLSVRYKPGDEMACTLTAGGQRLAFTAERGVWVGAKPAIYALSRGESGGYALFEYFRVSRRLGDERKLG